LETKALTGATKFLTLLAEQNISEIEKIHSRVKLNRFLGTNLIFSVSIVLIFSYLYVWINYANATPSLALFIPPLLFSILLIVITKIKKINIFIKRIVMLLFMITSLVCLIGMFYISFNSTKNSGLSNILTLVNFGSLFAFFVFLLFQISKQLSEMWIQTFFNKNYTITVNFINGEKYSGKLVTITRKGDYIIKGNSTQKDVLVKSNALRMVEIEENV
jgi:cation transport ATPase